MLGKPRPARELRARYQASARRAGLSERCRDRTAQDPVPQRGSTRCGKNFWCIVAATREQEMMPRVFTVGPGPDSVVTPTPGWRKQGSRMVRHRRPLCRATQQSLLRSERCWARMPTRPTSEACAFLVPPASCWPAPNLMVSQWRAFAAVAGAQGLMDA